MSDTSLLTIAGLRLLFVMAARAEYGAHLQARFVPLFTGVGPVEGGVATARALAMTPVDLVVSLGSAGSRSLPQGAVYQALTVGYRDMDASALGFAPGQTPFLDLPPVVPLTLRVPGVPQARLSTGGNVVSGAGYDRIDAEMVDMETYAVLRACQGAGVPLVALRGISDGAQTLERLSDWTEYLPLVDARLAEAVDRLLEALRHGGLAALTAADGDSV